MTKITCNECGKDLGSQYHGQRLVLSEVKAVSTFTSSYYPGWHEEPTRDFCDIKCLSKWANKATQ